MNATNVAQKAAPKPAEAPQPKDKPVTAKAAPVKAKPVATAKAKAALPAAKGIAKPAAKAAVKTAAVTAPAKPATKPVAKPVNKAPAVKAKPVLDGNSAAVAKPAQPANTAAKPAAAAPVEKDKPKKIKLVRDSFTMPEAEYAVLGQVKKTCLKAGVEVKKSELLRIGVALIRDLDIARLKGVLATLPQLKSGRPVKDK